MIELRQRFERLFQLQLVVEQFDGNFREEVYKADFSRTNEGYL